MSFYYELTDVTKNLEVEQWEINSEAFALCSTTPFSLRKKTLHGGKQEGSTIIEITAGDLYVSILPTRGMSLYKASYKGVDLGWDSPVDEIIHPSFIHLDERGGAGWLDGFNELMTRCGFEWSGHPCSEDGRLYSLHGRAANTPASKVSVSIEKEAPHRIVIKGLLKEKTFKFSDLEIWTTLTITPGEAGFVLTDELTNCSDYERTYQIIYHTNFGRPLLEQGARFVAPVKRVAPFNERAKQGLSTWQTYLGPTPGFDEEVFACELFDNADRTSVALHNAAGELGVALHYDTRELPSFTLWKNTDTERQGYVTGMEPGSNYPYAYTIEKAHGRLNSLGAGQSRSFTIGFQFMTSKPEVNSVLEKIERIANGRLPVIEQESVFLTGSGQSAL